MPDVMEPVRAGQRQADAAALAASAALARVWLAAATALEAAELAAALDVADLATPDLDAVAVTGGFVAYVAAVNAVVASIAGQVAARVMEAQKVAGQAGGTAQNGALVAQGVPVHRTTPPTPSMLTDALGRGPGVGTITDATGLIGLGVARGAAATLVTLAQDGAPVEVMQTTLMDTVRYIAVGSIAATVVTFVQSAFRSVAHAVAMASPLAEDRWMWVSRLSPTTCVACLGMHGRIFPASRTLESHVNCRCYPLALRRGRRPPDVMRADVWLAGLSDDAQRSILGPGRLALWNNGDVQLAQMVSQTEHPVWGRGIQATALNRLR